MENIANNFGFVVLGLILAAALFFGLIAWFKSIRRKAQERKNKEHRRHEMMKRVVQKTLDKQAKEQGREPVQFNPPPYNAKTRTFENSGKSCNVGSFGGDGSSGSWD